MSAHSLTIPLVTPPRERAKPLSPEERRRTIIDAVIPLLDPNSGPITTRQIADAAEIAEGTIFRVFPDKKTLFFAIAEEVTSPSTTDQGLRSAIDSADDLHTKIAATAGLLLSRFEKMLVVMDSLRASMAGEVIGEHKPTDGRTPTFLVNANQRLHATLTALIFQPHQKELRIAPEVAATALLGLIFGLAHPSAVPTEGFGPAAIATLLLSGIHKTSGDRP